METTTTTTTTTEPDTRPNVGARVRPATGYCRNHGTVIRRPADVTYVIVVWDFAPQIEQQVSFAETMLALIP
jgi:hypothetical protein